MAPDGRSLLRHSWGLLAIIPPMSASQEPREGGTKANAEPAPKHQELATACGQQVAEGETWVPTPTLPTQLCREKPSANLLRCPLSSKLARGPRETPGAQAGGTFWGTPHPHNPPPPRVASHDEQLALPGTPGTRQLWHHWASEFIPRRCSDPSSKGHCEHSSLRMSHKPHLGVAGKRH